MSKQQSYKFTIQLWSVDQLFAEGERLQKRLDLAERTKVKGRLPERWQLKAVHQVIEVRCLRDGEAIDR